MKLKNTIRTKFSTILLLAMSSLTLPLAGAAQGTITFTSNRDGDTEIFSMKSDGTLPTQLTDNTAADSQPSASADGSRIVFTSFRDGNNEIYVMNADGSGQTNLTNDPANDTEPAISPDGTRIAFVSVRNGFFQIFLINTDGSNLMPLTDFCVNPSFGPDGSKIVFAGYDGDYEIFTINIDGTNRTQITQNAANELYPKFSPDGNGIAFISDRDGDTAVYTMNADSTNQTRLAGTLTDLFATNQMSFSPDGTRIAFASRLDGSFDVYSINTDGSNQIRLTPSASFDAQPSWSGPPAVTPVLNAPSNLRAEYVKANEIRLRWTDNSTNETGFVIEQCRTKNCSDAVQIGYVGANTTAFLVTQILPNTQYIYRVAAINGTGLSTYSNSVMVKTLRK
jgi:Tol biopolymer transport system component